jgi:hypothetical protein
MTAYRVSPRVNNPRHEDAACMAPAAEQPAMPSLFPDDDKE